MVNKYVNKPVTIEAIQWTSDFENTQEILKWSDGFVTRAAFPGKLVVRTLKGHLYADELDYIIKGIKGEFYPCKPDIFEMTHAKAEE